MEILMKRMARPKPVQIQQQSIVMQSLKPDHEDHSHVYSSLDDDDGIHRDDDDHHHHHHHHQFQQIALLFLLFLNVEKQMSDQLYFMLNNLLLVVPDIIIFSLSFLHDERSTSTVSTLEDLDPGNTSGDFLFFQKLFSDSGVLNLNIWIVFVFVFSKRRVSSSL